MKYLAWLLSLLLIIPVHAQENSCSAAQTGNPCASTSRAPSLNLGVGNPIHVFSGNKFQHEQDLLLRLSGLEWSRFYNSMATIPGVMGAGWNHSYHVQLFQLPHAWQVLMDDGQRVMFHTPRSSPEFNTHHRVWAKDKQQGYLIKNSYGLWEWHTPEKTIRTFNSQGLLLRLQVEGFPTTEIVYTQLKSHTVLSRVHNKQEQLSFFYEWKGNRPVLSELKTPVGSFSYEYDIPKGHTAPRLVKVTRPDEWQRLYLYETRYQAGNPYHLTGIVLSSPERQLLRVGEWHYQEDGKAIYTKNYLNQQSLSLQYLSQANTPHEEIHTVVYDDQQRATHFKGQIKAGQYRLKEVSGQGCYFCSPRNIQARYREDGLMTEINGVKIERDEQDKVKTISFSHPAWGALQIDYDADGYVKSWSSPYTGKSLPGPHKLERFTLAQPPEKHDYAQIKENQLHFKNSLYLKQVRVEKGKNAILLKNNNETLWAQTQQYNPQGLLSKETFHMPSLQQRIEMDYAYDKKGRLIQAHQRHFPSGEEHSFFYAWKDNGESLAFAVDEKTVSQKIKRNAQGLPVQIGQRHLVYGDHRRIVQIYEQHQPRVFYAYDTYGRRIYKETSKAKVYFTYQGNRLHTETLIPQGSQSGSSTYREYFYKGILPVGFVEKILGRRGEVLSQQVFYIHNDHLGQAVMVTDHHQAIRWAAYYSPTGKAQIVKESLTFNLRLPGQYFDEETGWHDNYFRTYDPDAGHYLEPDPIGPLLRNSPYGYVIQQPRLFIDPLGLLLFAFDGTSNDVFSDTNVFKFYRLYEGKKFYKEGPGALPEEGFFERIGGVLFGSSINKILDAHKEFLINYMRQKNNNFTDVTPIDIVGFSRGAVIGMVFSNFVKSLVKDGLFSYVETYKENGQEKKRLIQSCVDLRFIGLFDAVAQLGILGSDNDDFDYTAAPEWEMIAHAVALNEYRSLFPLTTYNRYDNVVEQGFLGNHTDLGGVLVKGDVKDRAVPYMGGAGYGDLGNIPLAWIYTQALQVGVPLRPLGSVQAFEQGNLDVVKYPAMHNTIGNNYTPQGVFNASLVKYHALMGMYDRTLENADSIKGLLYQGESAEIGNQERARHIKAAEVEFLFSDDIELLPSSVRIYGKLNPKKYIAWLEKELNWTSPVRGEYMGPLQ